jgi:hypothetical protein
MRRSFRVFNQLEEQCFLLRFLDKTIKNGMDILLFAIIFSDKFESNEVFILLALKKQGYIPILVENKWQGC